MYIKSRERATDVVNIGTRVDIVMIEKKKSTVRTAKKIDTLSKNVTARRSMGNNARTITRRVTKKSSFRRNKIMTNKNKNKRLISLKTYVMTRSLFGDDELA